MTANRPKLKLIIPHPDDKSQRARIIGDGEPINKKAKPKKAKSTVLPIGMTARELQMTDVPETQWIVNGLIPEGVTIVAGPPKAGKTWLIIDIALAIASGGQVLGKTACSGDVLHLALEDSWARLKSRVTLIQPKGHWPDKWNIKLQFERFDEREGGIDDIRQWLTDHPDARCVIVDTFAFVKPRGDLRRNQYDLDVDAIKPLVEVAREFHVAIILVLHVRKAKSDDPFDMISGTMGSQGTADTLIILERKRNSDAATLYGTGRDLDSFTTPIMLENYRWQPSDDGEAPPSDEQKAVLDVMTTEPKSPKEIAELCGMKSSEVSVHLKRLLDKGRVINKTRGRWQLPE